MGAEGGPGELQNGSSTAEAWKGERAVTREERWVIRGICVGSGVIFEDTKQVCPV